LLKKYVGVLLLPQPLLEYHPDLDFPSTANDVFSLDRKTRKEVTLDIYFKKAL
jgi:hypothetical protein